MGNQFWHFLLLITICASYWLITHTTLGKIRAIFKPKFNEILWYIQCCQYEHGFGSNWKIVLANFAIFLLIGKLHKGCGTWSSKETSFILLDVLTAANIGRKSISEDDIFPCRIAFSSFLLPQVDLGRCFVDIWACYQRRWHYIACFGHPGLPGGLHALIAT